MYKYAIFNCNSILYQKYKSSLFMTNTIYEVFMPFIAVCNILSYQIHQMCDEKYIIKIDKKYTIKL